MHRADSLGAFHPTYFQKLRGFHYFFLTPQPERANILIWAHILIHIHILILKPKTRSKANPPAGLEAFP